MRLIDAFLRTDEPVGQVTGYEKLGQAVFLSAYTGRNEAPPQKVVPFINISIFL